MTLEGNLPESWQMATIDTVCQVNPPKPNLRGIADSTPVMFVPMAAVDEETGRISGAEERSLGAMRQKSYRTFTSGDVLFAKITPCMENGKAAVVPQIFSGLGFGSTEFHVLRPGPCVERKYLWHFVRQEAFRNEAEGHMTSSVGQARVPKEFMGQSLIPLPTSDEQRKIVDVLDSVTEKAKSAATHLTSAKSALEQFRQEVLAAACSGRLTADWRERNADGESALALVERSRAVLANRSRARRIIDDAAVPDWLEIPKTWEWAPLGSLAEIKGGIQKQPKRAPKKNAYPYLRVANVLRGRLDLSQIYRFELFDDELNTYRLVSGDLLIVEGNGSLTEIGRSAIWDGSIEDCVHQNHIIRVRCIEADPRFIDLVWNSPVGAREIAELAVTSSGLYSLSAGKIAAFSIPVPPPEEQGEIVRRASALLQLANAQLVRVDAATRRVEKGAQAALAKAFRGELSTAIDGGQNGLGYRPRRCSPSNRFIQRGTHRRPGRSGNRQDELWTYATGGTFA